MLLSALTLWEMCVTLLAQQQSKSGKSAEDMSKMSPVAHAPLFQAPNALDAGSLTDRVTAGLPATASGPNLTPRNFIDEQIFGKMQREEFPTPRSPQTRSSFAG
jgi:hypothetical protein